MNVIAHAGADGGPTAGQGVSSTALFMFQDSDSAVLDLRIPAVPNVVDRNRNLYKVVAGGRVTGGTTTNFTVSLRSQASGADEGTTVVEASTARAVDSASHTWFIEAVIKIGSTDSKMQGYGRSMVANLYDAEAALDNVITLTDELAQVGFNVTGTFSASNAGNLARCDYFYLEALV